MTRAIAGNGSFAPQVVDILNSNSIGPRRTIDVSDHFAEGVREQHL
jgi:hypothetical protein